MLHRRLSHAERKTALDGPVGIEEAGATGTGNEAVSFAGRLQDLGQCRLAKTYRLLGKKNVHSKEQGFSPRTLGIMPLRSSHRVLVVDDEPLIRLDVADTLREAGYQVLEACNADQAMKLLPRETFALILYARHV